MESYAIAKMQRISPIKIRLNIFNIFELKEINLNFIWNQF